MGEAIPLRPVLWVGSSKDDLDECPEAVRAEVGHALYIAQLGDKHDNAKPLRGFGGAHTLEIVESFDGDAYRAVYTVKFVRAIYVLHVFQKKSRSGVQTSMRDVELIKARLKTAEEDDRKWRRES